MDQLGQSYSERDSFISRAQELLSQGHTNEAAGRLRLFLEQTSKLIALQHEVSVAEGKLQEFLREFKKRRIFSRGLMSKLFRLKDLANTAVHNERTLAAYEVEWMIQTAEELRSWFNSHFQADPKSFFVEKESQANVAVSGDPSIGSLFQNSSDARKDYYKEAVAAPGAKKDSQSPPSPRKPRIYYDAGASVAASGPTFAQGYSDEGLRQRHALPKSPNSSGGMLGVALLAFVVLAITAVSLNSCGPSKQVTTYESPTTPNYPAPPPQQAEQERLRQTYERQRLEAEREAAERQRQETERQRQAAERQRQEMERQRREAERLQEQAARRERYFESIRCVNFTDRGRVCCPRGQRPDNVYTPRPAGDQYTIMCVRAE
jgi:hypothetical protein